MKKLMSLLMVMIVVLSLTIAACKPKVQPTDTVTDSTEVTVDTTAVVK